MHNYIYRFLNFFLSVFLIFIVSVFSQPMFSKASSTTVMVDKSDTITAYSNTGEVVNYNGRDITDVNVPMIKIGSVWMISVNDIIKDALGGTYTYDSDAETVTISNPRNTITIALTIDSKTATIGSTKYTMPSKVYTATNGNNGKEGILVPAAFILKHLGYYCSYSSDDKELSVTKRSLYSDAVTSVSYDKTNYNNVITDIDLSYNSSFSKLTFKLGADYNMESSYTCVKNDSASSITYIYADTYNALGDINLSFSNCFIEGISLTLDTSLHTTNLTVNYENTAAYTQAVAAEYTTLVFSKGAYSLKILLPDGVSFSTIENYDMYFNNKFYIIIPGDYTDFYGENEIVSNNDTITKVQVSLTSDDNTRITVYTSKLQGYKLIEENGYFYVNVGNPDKIYKHIVALDPGHGGKDSGTKNNGTKEKNLNLKILYTLAKQYFNSSDSDIKAYWTRTNDTFKTLEYRAAFSELVDADLFVSLHMNSCNKSSINATEIYYTKTNNEESDDGFCSKLMAKSMLSYMKTDLGNSSRGVKHANYYVTRYNSVPSILVELGFLSGNKDYYKLTNESYQKKSAKTIYDCIDNIFDTYF